MQQGVRRHEFFPFRPTPVQLGRPPANLRRCPRIDPVVGISGPFFDFNDTWQLVINTSTTIVTFLMVFLIQNTQNRDTDALHIKIDELLRSTRRAHNALLGLDDLDADTLRELRQRYQHMGEQDGETPESVAAEEERQCGCGEERRRAD